MIVLRNNLRWSFVDVSACGATSPLDVASLFGDTLSGRMYIVSRYVGTRDVGSSLFVLSFLLKSREQLPLFKAIQNSENETITTHIRHKYNLAWHSA
jgi:hypothetical protein